LDADLAHFERVHTAFKEEPKSRPALQSKLIKRLAGILGHLPNASSREAGVVTAQRDKVCTFDDPFMQQD
jgi:hypothetical protein